MAEASDPPADDTPADASAADVSSEPRTHGADARRRRTFGPVVLAGLAGAGLAAVAGHRAMLVVPEDYWTSVGSAVFGGEANADLNRVEFPLAGALALVSLACWGVILVARGRLRRAVAALVVLAAAGIVAVTVVGGFVQDDDAATDIAERVGSSALTEVPLDPTVWLWGALAGGAVTLAAGVLALRWATAWPEMGSRYDAPAAARASATSGSQAQVPVEERSHIDVWKSLDEGEDPTA